MPKKQYFNPKKCFETYFLVGLSKISLFLIKINRFRENEKVFTSLHNYFRMVGRGFFKRGHVKKMPIEAEIIFFSNFTFQIRIPH